MFRTFHRTPDCLLHRENGHDVSSALEIAGNEISFPKTGATVRAVPIADLDLQAYQPVERTSTHRADSRPGDTFWKGAHGVAPPPPPPPPDITMVCREEGREDEEGVELVITWNMSWSDVLDLLRLHFGRSCIFSYKGFDHKNRNIHVQVASEKEFDLFCSHAEKYGNLK